MRFWRVLALALTGNAVSAVFLPPRDADANAGVTSDAARAALIREAFMHSWEGYKQYAWGYDELLSVSNRGGNSRHAPPRG